MTDRELLNAYVSSQSGESFSELVRRHTPMVYSACVRILRDEHSAEDATQATFLILAQQARSVAVGKSTIAGWLYLTAQHSALQLRRALARRSRHEQKAAHMRSQTQPVEMWEQKIRPNLEPLLALLSPLQREALVARYLGGLSETDAARELGCSESAVNSRVKVALGKLRERLLGRGVAVSSATLAGLLSQHACETIPAGLAQSAASVALGQSAASAAVMATVQGVGKALVVAKLKAAVLAVSATLVLAICATYGICHLSGTAHPAPPGFGSPLAAPPAPIALPTPPLLGFFVAPDGEPEGDGSDARPWDLATALAHPPAVVPGSTIWVKGGTYPDGYNSRLSGTPDKPIIVRAVPGERAVLTGVRDSIFLGRSVLVSTGNDAWFWGLELAPNEPGRAPATSLNGVIVSGGRNKLINLVIHEVYTGIFAFAPSEDLEVYGCVLFHTGAKHAGFDVPAVIIYGGTAARRFADNIICCDWGGGFRAVAALKNFSLERNIIFGASQTHDSVPLLGLGALLPIQSAQLVGNVLYGKPFGAGMMLSMRPDPQKALEVRDNIIVGCESGVQAKKWEQLTFTGNLVYGSRTLLDLAEMPDRGDWDKNAYYFTGNDKPFVKGEQSLDFATWQNQALDPNSSYTAGAPKGWRGVYHPNRYEAKRAHITVLNWDKRAEIEMNMDVVLTPGDEYEIRDVQNWTGSPLIKAVYDGKPIRVPLTPPEMTQQPPGRSAHTGPEFNVFVLIGKIRTELPRQQ